MRMYYALDISADLIPDRATFTAEQDQFINELRACDERKLRITIETFRSILRALRHDEPEKQD